jgi:hypothetical protein
MSEPFVYLWYIASTKRYYLGVAIGKPYYTHSSSSKELCDIVPHSSNSLLEERKEFWDKYERGEIEGVRYRILPKRFILNVPYLTEDLDDYGKMCEREHVLLKNRFERCWNRYYNMSLGDPRYVDQYGENNPMYGSKRTGEEAPNWKGGIKVNDPKAYMKEYHQTQTPERKAHKRAYDNKRVQTPEYKAYKKVYDAERYARKKAETQGEGFLG